MFKVIRVILFHVLLIITVVPIVLLLMLLPSKVLHRIIEAAKSLTITLKQDMKNGEKINFWN